MLASIFSSRQGTPTTKAWPAPTADSPVAQPTAIQGAFDQSPRRLGVTTWREDGALQARDRVSENREAKDREAKDREARDQQASHQQASHQEASHERLLSSALGAPASPDASEEMAERAPDQDEQSDGEEGREFSFKRLVKHRWVGDSMEIQVEWDQGEKTWEPETNLHADALSSLLRYWVKQGGRPTNPADPDIFDIFAVRQHSADRKRLFVEWTGYGPKEASWVSCRAVEETAPELVAEYWKRARRGPGRPKKKKKKNKSRG